MRAEAWFAAQRVLSAEGIGTIDEFDVLVKEWQRDLDEGKVTIIFGGVQIEANSLCVDLLGENGIIEMRNLKRTT